MSVIIAHSADSAKVSKRVMTNQQRLEEIFHTVDTIKSDLNKCGMRLQEAVRSFSIPCIEISSGCLKVTYGIADETLTENAMTGQQTLRINNNDFFKKDKTVLIFNLENNGCFFPAMEFNEIYDFVKGNLLLKTPLRNNFPINSSVVVLKKIEYKYFPAQQSLKRKTDKGNFQPLLEVVSDFYTTYFPEANSVLYRIECEKREQIRGYIFLLNNVA